MASKNRNKKNGSRKSSGGMEDDAVKADEPNFSEEKAQGGETGEASEPLTTPDASSALFNPPMRNDAAEADTDAAPAAAEEPAEPVSAPAAEPVPVAAAQEPAAEPVAAAAEATAEPSTPEKNGGELGWAAAEKRLRELLPGVKDASVLQELAELADSGALERLVQRGKPPPKATPSFMAPRTSVKNNIFAASESMKKANDSQQVAKAATKGYGLVDNKALAVGGAGQGGGLGLNRPGAGPKVNHFAPRGSLNGAKSVAIDADVGLAWSEMMDDKSTTAWVIASYAADGKSLAMAGKGEGGLAEFKATLPEGIAWGGFRCNAIDKRGGLECKRPKFIFVCYKPESCSAIKKAKQASHKGDVKEAFPGAHVDVIVETMDDLDEQKLITQLQSATGAHKPNGYEFSAGTFLEADFYGLGIGKSCQGESSKN